MADQEPQVITLNESNSVEIILQFVAVAQSKGAFLLSEADILKRCRDILISNVIDSEINVVQAKQLIVQAIIKGQTKGSFTLDDASILHKVCQYISTNLTSNASPQQVPVQPAPVQVPAPAPAPVQQIQEIDEKFDLSVLSDPVPLKTSRPRIV